MPRKFVRAPELLQFSVRDPVHEKKPIQIVRKGISALFLRTSPPSMIQSILESNVDFIARSTIAAYDPEIWRQWKDEFGKANESEFNQMVILSTQCNYLNKFIDVVIIDEDLCFSERIAKKLINHIRHDADLVLKIIDRTMRCGTEPTKLLEMYIANSDWYDSEEVIRNLIDSGANVTVNQLLIFVERQSYNFSILLANTLGDKFRDNVEVIFRKFIDTYSGMNYSSWITPRNRIRTNHDPVKFATILFENGADIESVENPHKSLVLVAKKVTKDAETLTKAIK